jgi:uncharacterized protein (DUF1778 family)
MATKKQKKRIVRAMTLRLRSLQHEAIREAAETSEMSVNAFVVAAALDKAFALLIGRFLADTVTLDNNLRWGYMSALMYQWGNGPLPNDVEQCGRIMAQHGPDAELFTRLILTRFFVQMEDGRWMNLRNEAMRRDVEAQALRFSQRGRKANAVRWSGHTPKYPSRSPSGILQGRKGIHDGILKDSKMDSNKESILESIGSPKGVPVVLELGENLSPSLRSGGRAAAPLDRPQKSSGPADRGAKAASSTSGKAKTKQKRPEKAQDAPEGSRTGNRATQGQKRAGRPNSSRNLEQKKATSDPEKQNRSTDPRFGSFRSEYFVFWKALHPNGIKPPWGPLDGGALNVLFKRAPGLTVEQFRHMLSNRVDSEVNPSQPAREWLADVMKYANGPLNRFGDPKRKG